MSYSYVTDASRRRATARRGLAALGVAGLIAAGCSSGGTPPPDPTERQTGQSEFVSAPPGGIDNNRGGTANSGGSDASASADASASPSADAGAGSSDSTSTPRTVEETDIYRLDGNRVYYLNSYRGLMVFDVTDLDHPRLLGRSPIFGSPVEMIVRDGVAYALVADWYGSDGSGRPFHGSVVRAIDARDPAHITPGGEVQLRGWVRDARVVGDVLYTVGEYYGYEDCGYYGAGCDTSTTRGPGVTVSAVRIGDPSNVRVTGERTWDGYSGIINVTQNAILMAHDTATGGYYGYDPAGQTQIDYVDISDPNGAIAVRGSVTVNGHVQGWGPNNGRFNIDFDGARYVRTLSMQYGTYDSSTGTQSPNRYLLSTVDASDPNHLAVVNEFPIEGSSWSPAARFDGNRMFLSPQAGYYDYGATDHTTPVQVYDLSDALHPRLAGEVPIDGAVYNFIPAGDRVFALGSNPSGATTPGGYYSDDQIALRYIDVSDVAHPRLLGVSQFGAGWAWTPAAGDFKAFTMDATRGLVVLPFSGWSQTQQQYHNGVQLVEFTRDTLRTSGTALTRGWVERGIFVRNRLVSLSDLALQVIDYTDHAHPVVLNELTLARNVVSTQPMGDVLVQLVSDWWGNDDHSTLRVVPAADPDDAHASPALAELTIAGTNARAFANGSMLYVLSSVRGSATCGGYDCYSAAPHVQVIDLADPHHPRARGSYTLPAPRGYWYGGYGYYYYGWYGWWDGDDVVQVHGDVLAFRGPYDYGTDGTLIAPQLQVLDLANPDAPRLAATTVLPTPDGWWGNLRVAGDTLYVTHYDWVDHGPYSHVRYFLDRVDLSDRAAPRVLSRVNVPGIFVGASNDGRSVYTVDYSWSGERTTNTFNVLELAGDHAVLRGSMTVDGSIGSVYVRNQRAFFSAEHYDGSSPYGYPTTRTQLHMLDFSNPAAILDRASASSAGWGWLLGVEGDRAIVQSNWGAGVNVYRVADDTAPEFLSFQRTRGWWSGNVARAGSTLFISSGYYGVETVDLGR